MSLSLRIVHGLVGHAGAHGAIADHRDDVAVPPVEVPRHGVTQAGRDRGRAVRRAEGVVFALAAAGEAGQTAALAQRADTVAPPGQDLVRIALVADIPDQLVARRIENVMQGDRQLDDPQARAQVAPGDRNRVDHLLAQFVGNLAQVAFLQFAQIFRSGDGVQ
jgi:hypothetical protein